MSRWTNAARWLAERLRPKIESHTSLVVHQNTRNSLLNFITRETLEEILQPGENGPGLTTTDILNLMMDPDEGRSGVSSSSIGKNFDIFA